MCRVSSSEPGSSNRTALQSGVLDMVAGLERSGCVVDVSIVAARLLTEYPNSGLTFEEVRVLVIEAAVKKNAAVLCDRADAT